MSEKYKPVKGDRVRVSFEAEVEHVYWDGDLQFELVKHYVTAIPNEANFSVEKIEPVPVLPDGLVVSEDGNLLNWLGENYVRQQVAEPVEVFKPGDVVRDLDNRRWHYAIGKEGYIALGNGTYYADGPATYKMFTSTNYDLVDLSS